MKVKAGEVDGYLARIDRAAPSILLYGPDQGLVTERARHALSAVVEDVNDPFRVVDIEADTLRRQPARLIEEVQALSLMGGRRVVRVRFAVDAITKLFEPLMALEQQEALVIVEAGDLSPRSSLRRLFESARNAAALPCYRDEGGGLVAGIRRMLAEEGLSIDSDAMGYLQAHLGSDRELTRREIEKLALYMQSAEVEKVAIEDAAAVIGDSAALGQDDMVMATLLGDADGAAAHLDRLLAEGEQPVLLARTLALDAEPAPGTAPASRRRQDVEGGCRRCSPTCPFPPQIRHDKSARNLEQRSTLFRTRSRGGRRGRLQDHGHAGRAVASAPGSPDR